MKYLHLASRTTISGVVAALCCWAVWWFALALDTPLWLAFFCVILLATKSVVLIVDSEISRSSRLLDREGA